MGRASRRKREVREGLRTAQKGAPWWSVYAQVYRLLKRVEDVAETADEWPLFVAVRNSHVFYVDPLQAAAAPVPDTFSRDLLPFPVILLATGEESGDANSPPYAALMIDQRYVADRMEEAPADPLILPIYAAANGLLSFPGMCVLDTETGQLGTSDFKEIVDDGQAKPEHFEGRGSGRTAIRGSQIALAALDLLRSVNVDLVDGPPAPPAHRAGGVPSHEIVVRQHRSQRRSRHVGSEVEWSHRWEVRGHYKHFTQGPIFDANPDRRVEHEGVECVRVWCPPFVKGPEDKPLVPKARRTSRAIQMPPELRRPLA